MKAKKDYKSEVLDIIKTKNWDRARHCNDAYLYDYLCNHRDTDENCRIVWEHIRPRDYESEILEIIKTEDWNRVRQCSDKNLYNYIFHNKDIDENCRIVWEHKIKKHCPYTIKDYLLYYFKHGKLTKTPNESLYKQFNRQTIEGNQSCIDIKNLIVAAENFQDPIAIETLGLIKNHLEKEG